jgi:rare lipoprotein A
MSKTFLPILLSALLLVSACSETEYAAHVVKSIEHAGSSGSEGDFKVGKPYDVQGQTYYPREQYNHVETGIASWYGPGFHGKRTANGEKFDSRELTAAHKTLQMPSLIRVTNLDNGRSLVLRVNDRGPFSRGRILDVSERGAELLGFKGKGTAKVRVEVLEAESRQLAAMARAGQDTRGYEVALNRGDRPVTVASAKQASVTPRPINTPEPIQTVSLDHPAPIGKVEGHVSDDGRFMPDQVVQQMPVVRTNIYVQAGAFSNESNANALSQKLASIGPSRVYLANVNGRSLYRVRLGPYPDVEPADSALARVVSSGSSDAIIIVD